MSIGGPAVALFLSTTWLRNKAQLDKDPQAILEPLKSLATNQLISHCPTTTAGVTRLSAARVDTILNSLQIPAVGRLSDEKDLIRLALF